MRLHNPKTKYRKMQDSLYHSRCKNSQVRFTKSQIIKKIKLTKKKTLKNLRMKEKGSHIIQSSTMIFQNNIPKDNENENISSKPNNFGETCVNPGSIFDPVSDPNIGVETTSKNLRSTPMNIIKNEMLDEVKQEPLHVPFKELKVKNEKNKLKETADLCDSSSSTKKISVKDYQKKKEMDNDVQLVGEKIVRPFPQNIPVESLVKSEARPGPGPDDLLQGQPTGAVTNQTDPAHKSREDLTPEAIFYRKIVDLVKTQINMYFARQKDGLIDKQGNKKVIKIKGVAEYTSLCRTFSKKFDKEVKETYLATNNDSLEGIEDINVYAYGIDFEIHRFFSERPEVEPSFDT